VSFYSPLTKEGSNYENWRIRIFDRKIR